LLCVTLAVSTVFDLYGPPFLILKRRRLTLWTCGTRTVLTLNSTNLAVCKAVTRVNYSPCHWKQLARWIYGPVPDIRSKGVGVMELMKEGIGGYGAIYSNRQDCGIRSLSRRYQAISTIPPHGLLTLSALHFDATYPITSSWHAASVSFARCCTQRVTVKTSSGPTVVHHTLPVHHPSQAAPQPDAGTRLPDGHRYGISNGRRSRVIAMSGNKIGAK
jgi:hypothetical protein